MITRVEVENLRAYRRLSLHLQEGVNFLVGPNAIGTTSLLESISLAFVGEPLTVPDLTSLMRDADSPSKVMLAFVQDGTPYMLERNVRAKGVKGECHLQEGDGQRTRLRWDQLTSRVEGIFGTTAAFFKRIIYMCEGDIAHFVSEPPGETVTGQIDRLLGIDQLEASKNATRTALKYVSDRIERGQDLLARYQQDVEAWPTTGDEDAGVEPLVVLELLETEARQLEVALGEIAERRAELARSVSEMEKVEADLTKVAQLVAQGAPQKGDERPVIERLSDRLGLKASEVQALEEDIGQLRESVGHLKGRKQSHDDVLRLLRPADIALGDARTIPCPVCRKPLTHTERVRILSDVEDEMRRILDAQEKAKQQLAEREAMLAATRDEVDTLREHERRLAQWIAHYPDVDSASAARAMSVSLRESLSRVDLDEAKCRDQLKGVRDGISSASRLNQQLDSLGFESLAALRRGLVGLTKAELVLEASRRAIEQTVVEQRGHNLEDVYGQIAEAWRSFVERSEWRVQFDAQGQASLHDVGEGRTFDLRQLSGGEKTALLAIIHSVLASRFSEARFMMIDEPLEHLDVVNRRSLVKFFVEAFDKSFFEQMIVTTFEESLVRKYLSAPGVNIIYLDAYRPELRLLTQESA